jgi:hypothetical protein
MTLEEISKYRLINQQIEKPEFETAKEMVAWMGAMQAQDFPMSKWAIGIRILNSTEKLIETAYNNGEIIRTHLMRPTWHFVSPDDIYWMLDLTAPKIKSSMKSRNNQLELTKEVFKKSNQLIEIALQKNKYLNREELSSEFEKANIKTDNNRLSHLLMEAELDQIICSGPIINNKLTYSLLQERVPTKKTLTKDESLAELAKRYFTSHGPATLKDFVWWSGLSVNEARKGNESLQSNFLSETIDSEKYWFTNSFPEADNNFFSVHLLPAFDEYLISYRNRSASIEQIHNINAIFNNGIFRPIVVINGKVAGIWKRNIKKDRLLLEIESFIRFNKSIKVEIEKAAQILKNFLEKEIEISYK